VARSSAFVGVQHKVLGVAFLVLLAVFAWLTYAIFNKSFASYDEVTLQTAKAGLQLPSRADVKIRGVRVGEVLDSKVVGSGKVDLTLGLYPSAVHIIPANVSARILPKTLFGEKYVALQVPRDPSSRSIRAGAVISETRVSIEVEQVLSDIYPLLRTVQPAQLNYTLTAMADALEGRGEKIGQSLVVLDGYLKRANPQIPLLVDDLNKLATVSDTYAQVVPDVATLLRNSVTTGNTLLAKQAKVKALFDDVASFSSTSKDFLEQNGDNIIRLSKQGQAQLPLFAKYSPEYPCLLKGIVGAIPLEEQAFRGYTLHINLETLPRQPRGYNAGDQPVYAEHGEHRVPLGSCEAAIHGRWNQGNLPPDSLVPEIQDGVKYPLGKKRAAPQLGSYDVTSGYAGTQAERAVVDSVAGPAMGVPPTRVPDVASLLFAPLARGSEVSLR
jgi:phospholipid/cholesterol/gamma-HCH transport system substrate-binding protein